MKFSFIFFFTVREVIISWSFVGVGNVSLIWFGIELWTKRCRVFRVQNFTGKYYFRPIMRVIFIGKPFSEFSLLRIVLNI